MIAAKVPTCMVRGCPNQGVAGRGLCSQCYHAARYLIRTQQATWQSLESLGLAKPRRYDINENKLVSAFRKAVEKKRQRKAARK